MCAELMVYGGASPRRAPEVMTQIATLLTVTFFVATLFTVTFLTETLFTETSSVKLCLLPGVN